MQTVREVREERRERGSEGGEKRDARREEREERRERRERRERGGEGGEGGEGGVSGCNATQFRSYSPGVRGTSSDHSRIRLSQHVEARDTVSGCVSDEADGLRHVARGRRGHDAPH
eukprot:752324-Hanusia_phi.AAC.3